MIFPSQAVRIVIATKPVDSRKGHDGLAAVVRRQSFWNQERPKLRESLAHLISVIMRRVVCDASAAFRASFV